MKFSGEEMFAFACDFSSNSPQIFAHSIKILLCDLRTNNALHISGEHEAERGGRPSAKPPQRLYVLRKQ